MIVIEYLLFFRIIIYHNLFICSSIEKSFYLLICILFYLDLKKNIYLLESFNGESFMGLLIEDIFFKIL